MAPRRWLPGPVGWRRLAQLGFFVLFLVLFVKTDYSGVDELHGAVNLLFRIDPLLALTAMLAAKTVVVLMLPALATVALTLVFGRAFCGWVCPMGTLIDASRTLFGRRQAGEVVNVEIDPQTQAVVDTVERVLAAKEAAIIKTAEEE